MCTPKALLLTLVLGCLSSLDGSSQSYLLALECLSHPCGRPWFLFFSWPGGPWLVTWAAARPSREGPCRLVASPLVCPWLRVVFLTVKSWPMTETVITLVMGPRMGSVCSPISRRCISQPVLLLSCPSASRSPGILVPGSGQCQQLLLAARSGFVQLDAAGPLCVGPWMPVTSLLGSRWQRFSSLAGWPRRCRHRRGPLYWLTRVGHESVFVSCCQLPALISSGSQMHGLGVSWLKKVPSPWPMLVVSTNLSWQRCEFALEKTYFLFPYQPPSNFPSPLLLPF